MLTEISDKSNFIALTQTLDSLRDLAISEFSLIELDHKDDPAKSAEETKKLVEFVLRKAQEFRGDIAVEHQREWKRLNPVKIRLFNEHIAVLSDKAASAPCPPGFHEVGGVCVRI
ncbi:MAG: hypothetical protein HOP17_09605 [Acidobacteria bacterium]|nr:hypothetical protein [Acidobacteriota bacterium]